MAFENTFSPVLHRIDQAVRWRAVHPSDPIPPLDEILVRYSKPPDGLARRARPQLEKLMALAEIKKGPTSLLRYPHETPPPSILPKIW